MERYLKILKNKYFIVTLFIVTWMTFFDSNNFIHRIQNKLELQELKQDKRYYQQKIKETRQNKKELIQNKETLEKFAREQYFMKKEDEDVYVIIEED